MTVLRNVIEDMAADNLPCVAIAYRLLDETENIPTSEEELARWSLPEDYLVLLAIVGLKVCISSRINTVMSSASFLETITILEESIPCELCIEMQDPCRPGVKDAVRLCQKAGVRVIDDFYLDMCRS